MNEIPFDKWTEVTTEETAKKGRRSFVYRPSNYTGPLAIDAVITKEIDDTVGTRIWLSKDETKIMFGD